MFIDGSSCKGIMYIPAGCWINPGKAIIRSVYLENWLDEP